MPMKPKIAQNFNKNLAPKLLTNLSDFRIDTPVVVFSESQPGWLAIIVDHQLMKINFNNSLRFVLSATLSPTPPCRCACKPCHSRFLKPIFISVVLSSYRHVNSAPAHLMSTCQTVPRASTILSHQIVIDSVCITECTLLEVHQWIRRPMCSLSRLIAFGRKRFHLICLDSPYLLWLAINQFD